MATLYNVVVRNRHVEGGNVAVIEFESANSATLPKLTLVHILMCTYPMVWYVSTHYAKTQRMLAYSD